MLVNICAKSFQNPSMHGEVLDWTSSSQLTENKRTYTWLLLWQLCWASISRLNKKGSKYNLPL